MSGRPAPSPWDDFWRFRWLEDRPTWQKATIVAIIASVMLFTFGTPW